MDKLIYFNKNTQEVQECGLLMLMVIIFFFFSFASLSSHHYPRKLKELSPSQGYTKQGYMN